MSAGKSARGLSRSPAKLFSASATPSRLVASAVAAIPPAVFDRKTIAVLGHSGSGKSFAAKGAVEAMLLRGERVVVLDPTGVWWGLRASADGIKPGFAVAVFGGLHGDVEIVEASGAPLAQLIADRNLPAIVDLSEFTMGAQNRFATAFLEQLYHANRRPLTIVVDEADLFAPQRPMPDQTVLLNRMEQIVRRGRVRGFRPWLITQRPAELHKSVLSQAGTVIAMRLIAPQDRDAFGSWIEGQADRDTGKTILAALPKLATGEGFVWSPASEFLERITFPPITTFDSGRTPEHGESIETPERLADIDLAGVLDALKDPGPVGKRGGAAAAADGKAIEAAQTRGYADGYAAGRADGFNEAKAAAAAAVAAIAPSGALVAGPPVQAPQKPVTAVPPVLPIASKVSSRPSMAAAASPGLAMPKAERLILTSLVQYPAGRSKQQIAVLTGYLSTGGGFNNAISALRSKGFVFGGADQILATDAGVRALGTPDVLPRGQALRDFWLGRLGKAERESLRALCRAYPHSLTKQQIAQEAGYEATGGGFSNALSKLRRHHLIVGTQNIVASPDLFDV